MGSFSDLFAGSNFKRTIQQYCADQGWNLVDLSDKRAVLKFRMDSGRIQTLYILKYDTTLEFSVPSELAYEDNDIPHRLSTLLLKRNTERKIGFWCLEVIEDEFVFECMHNAEMQLINSAYFESVVRTLVNECDEFESAIRNL
ncbi:hypothetical protein [Sphaerotilus microaerophilus]|uniref:YbjN domain-containing protein n=1 Tax=Sphaerotilus microaerophilus TaxID=2914710 RepID=A0ABN6PHI2_9BURK|nr:hypothetical protein [Sphaerotilus sp. FB-5]BDI04147.1 hypothetical protein CATMQ487_11170 [Sphaerotilus sp. FB-5]